MIRITEVDVSEKGLKLRVQRRGEPAHCNCTEHYRRTIHFRHAILDVYEKQGEITEAQVVSMLVAFITGSDKGVLRLLGKDAEAVKTPLRRGGSFYASLEKLGKDEESDRNEPDKDFLWEWLASMELRGGPGRRERSDTRLLLMDAVILMFCPNAYLHLLEDALRLRAREYYVEENYARAHQDRYAKFWKARRAVETSCKRIWRDVYGQNPKPPQPPPKCKYWWERVARQQGGLIG